MRNLAQAIHTLQDSASPAHANFQVAWANFQVAWAPTWGQFLDHLPHDYDEYFDPGGGSVADELTLSVWRYFTGELPMPADFFVDAFDVNKYGRGYFRGTPAPDGGRCDCK